MTMLLLRRLSVLLIVAAAAACGGSTPPPANGTTAPAASSSAPATPSLPETAEQATAAREKGAKWTDVEVRQHYLQLVGRIQGANEKWKREGLSAEERAKRAYGMRFSARMTTRAMMGDAEEVEDLRKRDQRKYGHPDGPTFEELVANQKKKGVSGDAVYEAIVTSAQRTDAIINELLAPHDAPPEK